jgi:4'-phosphopantetheinyl transferase
MMDVQFVSIWHDPGVPRAEARTRIRLALRAMVAAALGFATERIALHCVPGSAPRLLVDGVPSAAGVSFAHDGQISVAAYHAHGPVGVDLMQVQETPDWFDVARDYLGPQAAASLAATPAAERGRAFAQAWTRREACLKCLGLALSEWTELPDVCRIQDFAVAPGYVGMIALSE